MNHTIPFRKMGLVYPFLWWYTKKEMSTMPEMKRTNKDSVFTYLFSDPAYACELYRYLHPEDTNVTEADCKLVTIQNILSNGQYNDLGLLVRDILIILAEAQSTFSPNAPIRVFLYMAQEYKDYIDEHKLNLYSACGVL